jgi:peptidoglycan/LPS O-acetylase OafA/YrhL
MQVDKKRRIVELDALRGIAALAVVLFHLTMGRSQYNFFFKYGCTGVDLFFIISGFVIFMSLQHITKSINFIINRISRLYPTYWVSVTFTFVATIALAMYNRNLQPGKYLVEFLSNLTMFQFYLKQPNLDDCYWTMIIEMIFYILILVLFQLKLLKYLKVIGVFTCSIIFILTNFFWGSKFSQFIIIVIPLLQFLPLFFVGTIFYQIYTLKEKRTYNYFIIVFYLLCQIWLYPVAGASRHFISWPAYAVMLCIYFTVFTLFVHHALGFVVNKITLFFRKISFALYLTHQFISLSIIVPFFYNTLGINFWVVALFIDLPIVVGIASLITYKVEVPYSKKMKEKLLKVWARYRPGLPAYKQAI